jgi:hypothetical protein
MCLLFVAWFLFTFYVRLSPQSRRRDLLSRTGFEFAGSGAILAPFRRTEEGSHLKAPPRIMVQWSVEQAEQTKGLVNPSQVSIQEVGQTPLRGGSVMGAGTRGSGDDGASQSAVLHLKRPLIIWAHTPVVQVSQGKGFASPSHAAVHASGHASLRAAVGTGIWI